MAIEHFIWTAHAQLRLGQRHLDRLEVEQAIRERHDAREVNDGRAQWLVRGETAAGAVFEVIHYDAHGDDIESRQGVLYKALEPLLRLPDCRLPRRLAGRTPVGSAPRS